MKIRERIAAGEELAPPPNTAIAGPEYFGFNRREVPPSFPFLMPDAMSPIAISISCFSALLGSDPQEWQVGDG
jgi:hypothetical protein